MLEMIENKFAKFLSFGLLFVTILVIAGPVTDPVNVPKLLALGVFGFGVLPYFKYLGWKFFFFENRTPTILVSFFVLAALSALLFSKSPFPQNFYGFNGRNTGFLTFLLFAIYYLALSSFRQIKNIVLIIRSLLIAGLINILYGFIDRFMADPIPWNNNYGAFLGTFGNPNFSGAFMGLMVGLGFTFLLSNLRNTKQRLAYSLFTFSSIVVVAFTKTTQGVLVGGLTASIAIMFYIHKQIRIKWISISASIFFIISCSLVLLGVLNKGLFASLLYKRTVSLRGSYWEAAINVGNSNFFTGVGLDSFGDWYRRGRSLKAATWLPGPEVSTNAAHNVYLDMYANGGIFLLISYASITILAFLCIWKISRNMKNFDPIPISLITLFFGFQAQSIISIAQIGIAIWGWAICGLLLSYSRILNSKTEVKSPTKFSKIQKKHDSPVGVFIFVFSILGALISVPPFSADNKYTSAINTRNVANIENSMIPNYFNPLTSYRLASVVVLFEQNQIYEKSHKYALNGVEFNPYSYEAWKYLYYIKYSTESEKKLALRKMKELDPLNPNLEKLK